MAVAFRLLKTHTQTWNQVWKALAAKYGDTECYDSFSGERWQYMSTTWLGDRARHEFRHRSLPMTGKREDFVFVTRIIPADYVGWVESK